MCVKNGGKVKRRLLIRSACAAALALGAGEGARAVEPAKSPFGTVAISGFLQGWFETNQTPYAKDGVLLRRAEIKFSGQAHPGASWLIVIDPAKPVNIKTQAQGGAITAAQADPKSLILKDMAFVFSAEDKLPGASLQAGQFKPPFGMEGIASSSMLDTAERSALSSTLGWSDYRDVGAMVKYGRGPWQVLAGFFNGEGPNTSDANRDKDFAGKIAVEPGGGLHLGLSGYTGRGKAARYLNERWGGEFAWLSGPWFLKGEFAAGHGATSTSASPGQRTAYGTLGRALLPDLQGVARLDWWDPDTAAGGDIQKELTLGLNWLVKDHDCKLQANFVLHGEEGPSVNNDVFRLAAQMKF